MSNAIEKPPPLGSWPRFYALACLAAVTYIALLYWFTSVFNNPGAGT